MKKNMGSTDKIIRIFIALVIVGLWYKEIISGTIATVFGVFVIIFLLTSLISFCPLYLPFGINTSQKP
ncbi:DUF2892 domain-containing protein [Flavobacterium sp.]|uniref:YgaP family membrane protein n=1 Tax=Flavobacterium sp. TaxID=239 RepID=UPI003750DD59